jgi:allantoinase
MLKESVMLIKNGYLALPGEADFIKKDLKIDQGKISEIADSIPGDADIDATGLEIFPGGIDPHVHFYDPGYTDKEDFMHGTGFAASGGITTIVDMPCTSDPPVSNAANLEHKLEIVGPKAHIDYGFFGGVSRQMFDAGFHEDMDSIQDHVLGYKVYAVSGAEETWGALDHFRFYKVMEHAQKLGKIILLHAEDAEYVNNASEHFKNLGKDAAHWYAARPELAEVLAVQSAIRIAEELNADLHIVHVGTSEAAALIDRAGTEKISGETCPQYLAFTLDDFIEQGPALKISPPIKKSPNDSELWELLSNASLSFIASDHAPGTPEEKKPGDIWCNSAGIAGTGTMFPFLYSSGLKEARISLEKFLRIISSAAAERYRIDDRKGSIARGKDADLVLVNPKESWKVDEKQFYSKGKLSPFHGRTFTGKIHKTLVRGGLVYDHREGVVGDPGHGRFIRPKKNEGGKHA